MALENVLGQIPGLGGYMAQRQFDQQQTGAGLAQLLGVHRMIQEQQQAEQRAQLQPLQLQMLQAQAGQAQNRLADDQALSQALPVLAQQYLGGETPDYRGFAQGLMGVRGGMQPGLNFLDKAENRDTRVAEGRLNRDAQMERLSATLGMQDQWKQMSEQNRMQIAAMMESGRMDRAAFAAALKSASGGGGGGSDKREPYEFSIGGKNVLGTKDRYGNLFDASGKAVTGGVQQPKIAAADQALTRKNAEEEQAVVTVSKQLDALESLAKSNPRSVAGPAAGLVRGVEAASEFVVPGAIGTQATDSSQLIRSIISNLPKTGRLAVYQQQELRRLFVDGFAGNATSLQKGINLLRENLSPREAAVDAPIGRTQPSAGGPPLPPGFKRD